MFVRAVHAHVFVSPSLDIWRLERTAEKGGDNISCSTCILTLSIYSGEIVGSSRIPELFWPPFQHLFRRILLRFNLDECICCPFLTPLPVPLLPQNVYLWRALPGHHVYIPAVKSPIGLKLMYNRYGESHCKSVGCIVDGVPPGMELMEDDIQPR